MLLGKEGRTGSIHVYVLQTSKKFLTPEQHIV